MSMEFDTKISPIQPLPADLLNRYKDWHKGPFTAERELYEELVEHGQHPSAMVISCCDSRVHSMALFGGKAGDFFIHRNIANMVPPFDPEGDCHGTSAALEYAVTVLKVAHVIILGHSGCGGINGGFHLHRRPEPDSGSGLSFVEKWLEFLKPAFDRLDHNKTDDACIHDLEKTSIVVSMENLMAFPFIQQALAENRLTIHGLWHNIAGGDLHGYDPATGAFTPL